MKNLNKKQAKRFTRSSKASALITFGVLMLSGTESFATNGFFMHGYGTNDQMAGAGSAHPQDTLAAAANPAGMAWLGGTRMDVAGQLFVPLRGFDPSDNAIWDGMGKQESGRLYYLIPSLGFSYQMDELSTIGWSVYGAGLGTKYWASHTWNDYEPGSVFYQSGAFFDGMASIDLLIAINEFSYSRKVPEINFKTDWGFGLKNVSFGYGALLSMSAFKAEGLGLFSLVAFDKIPSERDFAMGNGYSAGVMGDIFDDVTLSIGYHSAINQQFKKYSGLFAGGGAFTIPERVNIGTSWKASNNFRVNFDYEFIKYSAARQIGNDFNQLTTFIPGTQEVIGFLGSLSGAGFGWEDSHVFKLGAEYKFSSLPKWTWRAGISHQDQIVPKSEVLFNTLAPGVIEDHYAFGFTHQTTQQLDLSMQVFYAPREYVYGQGKGINNFGEGVEIYLEEFGLEGKLGYKF